MLILISFSRWKLLIYAEKNFSKLWRKSWTSSEFKPLSSIQLEPVYKTHYSKLSQKSSLNTLQYQDVILKPCTVLLSGRGIYWLSIKSTATQESTWKVITWEVTSHSLMKLIPFMFFNSIGRWLSLKKTATWHSLNRLSPRSLKAYNMSRRSWPSSSRHRLRFSFLNRSLSSTQRSLRHAGQI